MQKRQKIQQTEPSQVPLSKVAGLIGDGINQIFEFKHPAAPFVGVDIWSTHGGFDMGISDLDVQRYNGGVRVISPRILKDAEYSIVIIG